MKVIIKSDSCLEFVLSKMRGNLRLKEGVTEEDEMELYRETNHLNYFIKSGDGFLCVAIYDEFVTIPFAWHIGKHSTLKEMAQLGKDLYKFYTLKQDKPIYYTGKRNLYKHNSREIKDGIWVFEPKML